MGEMVEQSSQVSQEIRNQGLDHKLWLNIQCCYHNLSWNHMK